jgi:VWFA-related protein
MLVGIGRFSATAQESPQEEVTVTAVEIPVRVLLKGQPVKDLTKDDFELYENGVRQDISHFEIISRTIAAAQAVPAPAEKPQPKKRLFILIFNVFDYNDAIGQAIDYFFSQVFQPNDQIIAVTEDRVLSVERGKKTDDLVRNLKESLQRFKAISTQNTLRIFRDLRYESDHLVAALQGIEPGKMSLAELMLRYIERYIQAWDEYHRQYLMPDAGFYLDLVQRVRTIEGDKWAVCFQQRDMFPRIKSASRLESEITRWIGNQIDPQEQAKARNIQARMNDLERSFDLSNSISPDALRDIFMSDDITFHLILLRSVRTLADQDFELWEVSGDYEESLKKISEATGGYLALNNQPMEALKEAAELEDYHYLLVYSPKDSAAKNKRVLQVKVQRSGVEVISLKNYVAAGPPLIAIADFKAGGQKISFALLHYKMAKVNDKTSGLADIKITIFDGASNKAFDEGKRLDLVKKETHISLNFPQLKPGTYFIIIQAIDRVANRADVYSGMIRL